MNQQIKTIVISLVFLTAVVGALVWFGGKNSQPQTAAIDDEITGGILTARETDYDFGGVGIKNGLVNHEYVLENASDKIVKIGEVSTSCMCTTAQVIVGNKTYGPFGMPGHLGASKVGAIVNPGEKIIVKATFDPAAHGPTGIGEVLREIYIDIGADKPLTLSFRVNVTP